MSGEVCFYCESGSRVEGSIYCISCTRSINGVPEELPRPRVEAVIRATYSEPLFVPEGYWGDPPCIVREEESRLSPEEAERANELFLLSLSREANFECG